MFFEGIQIYPTFIIIIAIMITILVFHYGFFDSVTFILPCHCLAVLTKGVSRGGTARVFHRGGAYNRTSLPPSASKFLVSKAAGGYSYFVLMLSYKRVPGGVAHCCIILLYHLTNTEDPKQMTDIILSNYRWRRPVFPFSRSPPAPWRDCLELDSL